jgi:hypothetical protein
MPEDNCASDPNVMAEMKQAWVDSKDGTDGHMEQGGWIVIDKGQCAVKRWPATECFPNKCTPTKPSGVKVVGEFHTHPYGPGTGFYHSPSWGIPSDYNNACKKPNLSYFVIDRQSVMTYRCTNPKEGIGQHDDICRLNEL